jgi:phage gp36-like protein
MYCTPDDVRRTLVDGDADEADIQQTAAAMSDEQFGDHIADAQSEVDSRLAVRYVVPLDEADLPTIVKQMTANIAAYLATLTFRRTLDLGPQDPVFLRYQRAESMLAAIVAGKAQLPVPPPEEPPAPSSTMTGRNRYFGNLFTPSDFDLR